MNTTATAVLEDLHGRGIQVELEDDRDLILRPSELIDSEVTRTVRDLKPTIVRHLRLAAVGADRPDGLAYLLERLRAGSNWLDATRDTLDALPNAGLDITTTLTTNGSRSVIEHSRLSVQFNNSFDLWLRLENLLREVFDYQGCVLDKPTMCDPTSVVLCRLCRDVIE